MKTTIEVGGYEIKIEEMEGNITVSAMKDGEVMEEFELETEGLESQDMGEDDDMMSFGDEEMEDEGEFGDDDMGEDDEEFGDDDDMEEEEEEMEDETGKLESFSFFVKKRKK